MEREIERRIIDVLRVRGPMNRSDLQKMCSNRKWTAKQYRPVLAMLEIRGIVIDIPVGKLTLNERPMYWI